MTFQFQRLQLGITNCYLLRGETMTVLVDAGAPGSLDNFTCGLQNLEIDPKEIGMILLTHGHMDHIGVLADIRRLTNAQVVVHEGDRAWVESGQPALPQGITLWGNVLVRLGAWFYRPRIIPSHVDKVFDDSGFTLDAFGIPGKVIHTPGHSPGSSCVILESGEVFAGDTAVNAWFLRSNPGLAVLGYNKHLIIDSWKKIIRIGAKWVYPAHGDDFSIDVIQKEMERVASL
jgi:glyoxylase-like metal-dependent hydrolase (beta-lactamase superfamily II)